MDAGQKPQGSNTSMSIKSLSQKKKLNYQVKKGKSKYYFFYKQFSNIFGNLHCLHMIRKVFMVKYRNTNLGMKPKF